MGAPAAGRRFAGSEILLEIEAPDGTRMWSVAGPGVRRLRIGDSVRVHLRDVETVAFSADLSEGAAPPA